MSEIKLSLPEVKFLDLTAQYPLIKDEILRRFEEIIGNSAFVAGRYVADFEEAFADYCGVKHCIAVNNGTSALYMALQVKGIGFGDEVMVPVNTFIATAEAVSMLGAKPVFVDIDEETYHMNLVDLERKITEKTRAIIPVHLYGQCVAMDGIMELAKVHDLLVIEDACQAHGAEYKGKKAGSLGDLAAFSFYAGKNLGAWGEGGAITTNDDEVAVKLRLYKDHGSRQKYHHEIVGSNFRMNEFQGAVLGVKLRHLDAWNERRRENADLYLDLLEGSDVKLPVLGGASKHVWHLFVVRHSRRDEFMDFMKGSGIGVGVHYPFPLHLTAAYMDLGYRLGDFPVAEKVQSEIVSLPMYAELSREEIGRVAAKVKEFQ